MIAPTHEKFMVTVMTVPGKVKKLTEGKFGAYKVHFRNYVKGVLKPKLHSNESFRGVPRNQFHLREVAAYQLDWKLLHFDVVPPTVLTMYKGQQASVQAWVPGYMPRDITPKLFRSGEEKPREHLARFMSKIDSDALRRVIIFDLIVNNTDRHLRNCMFDPISKSVWAIDNGLAFGKYFRAYNNVFHRRIFRQELQLTSAERTRLESITLEQLRKVLARYLSPSDIRMTYQRIKWVLAQPGLAWELVSKGGEGRDGFPAYHEVFRRPTAGNRNKILARVDAMSRTRPTLTREVFSQ